MTPSLSPTDPESGLVPLVPIEQLALAYEHAELDLERALAPPPPGFRRLPGEARRLTVLRRVAAEAGRALLDRLWEHGEPVPATLYQYRIGFEDGRLARFPNDTEGV
ncbi:MAG: hypothetical protein IRY99_08370 [Isosphaeraceae bacterium]|nr:hypothetical protein [Isosphaeraceae bacterium]